VEGSVPASSVLPPVANQTPACPPELASSFRKIVRMLAGSELKSNTLVLARTDATVRHAARVWMSIFRIDYGSLLFVFSGLKNVPVFNVVVGMQSSAFGLGREYCVSFSTPPTGLQHEKCNCYWINVACVSRATNSADLQVSRQAQRRLR